jgi:hypothetical protein
MDFVVLSFLEIFPQDVMKQSFVKLMLVHHKGRRETFYINENICNQHYPLHI